MTFRVYKRGKRSGVERFDDDEKISTSLEFSRKKIPKKTINSVSCFKEDKEMLELKKNLTVLKIGILCKTINCTAKMFSLLSYMWELLIEHRWTLRFQLSLSLIYRVILSLFSFPDLSCSMITFQCLQPSIIIFRSTRHFVFFLFIFGEYSQMQMSVVWAGFCRHVSRCIFHRQWCTI